jgi:hypothetical protein
MKNLLTFILLTVSVSSFGQTHGNLKDSSAQNKITKQHSLIGIWKKTAELSDPGDGSGIFIDVNSDKTIEFKDSSEFVSNYSLCYMEGEKAPTKGKYSMKNSTIEPNNCSSGAKYTFDNKNENLIIHYICKEGCAEKYGRVK